VGAADNAYRHVARFSEALNLVLDNYVDPVDADRLLQGAYEGMLGGLDASGTYLSAPEVEEWLAKEADSESDADPGMGVLKSFGALQVVRVVPGSPAAAAGISVGDQIRRLDGKAMREVSLEQGIRMLRGKPGTTVTLGILHASEGLKREDVALRRVRRTDPAFKIEIRKETAILTVAELARSKDGDLADALRDAREKGASRLLLDIRNVVEGSPREAVPLLSQFLSGPLAVRKDRSGHVIETLASARKSVTWSGPVGVLVNGATAGGAESVAALLQGSLKAPVYGQPTYGRAAEPKLFKLSNGSGILIPASQWETAAGRTWEGDGLKPDQLLAAEGTDRDTGAMEQLRRALEEFEKSVAPAEAKKAA
jgi:carboxyl-terminal processing protease